MLTLSNIMYVTSYRTRDFLSDPLTLSLSLPPNGSVKRIEA